MDEVDFSTAVSQLFQGISQDWIIALAVLVGLIATLIAFCYTTQAGVIARATTKEAVRQPIFFLMLFLAMTFLLLNTFLPFFSLGEDLKMFKDVGLITIMFCGMFLGIWTSSISISEEIEGKTAMTLLSKPINRRQFITGKYFGIMNGVIFLIVPLVVVFAALIYYKVGYDAREGSQTGITAADRLREVIQVLPSTLLVFLEVAVMTAVSVAISTRLPMIVNIVTCMAIFVVGHLTPVLAQTVFAKLEFVKFMALMIATILPALEAFKTDAIVATGKIVPPMYLGTALAYCVFYTTAAILLAFILFEDRDLA
ncbi:ABC transporter permease subunit [Thalassoroseus pseudoceratinae]|uniref:ABC transporter permease subunit n=1 Tax=Thalassoroseus pseudoceratinae TaxID=2713176 RepID=UPI0014229F42|nr:ABC transporter permease subunit [Thalassoroseus pseudoceratinae]